MNLDLLPTWVRVSERAFAINFICFSFVMSSCLFPTGFSATFSTLAFLFALPIFFYMVRFIELNRFEVAGLGLFGWLLASVFWSQSPTLQSLAYLSEYRIYFMLPVFISVLSLNRKTQYWSFGAVLIGASVALVASYGLGLNWWRVEGAQFSLGNRIYHGFIMACFLLACLLIAREFEGKVRAIASVMALLVFYNVLNIEVGRTGYLLVFFVFGFFFCLTLSRTKVFLAFLGLIVVLGFSYLSFDQFQSRVQWTIGNVRAALFNGSVDSSAGHRLEFYRLAIDIGTDHPLTGVGVGDAANELRSRFDLGDTLVLTDNVHSEFSNMLVVGGIPAFLLFLGFVVSIIYMGRCLRKKEPLIGDMLIGLGLILMLSAIFNSSIKDYGEKHALMIMLSILGASLSSGPRNIPLSGMSHKGLQSHDKIDREKGVF